MEQSRPARAVLTQQESCGVVGLYNPTALLLSEDGPGRTRPLHSGPSSRTKLSWILSLVSVHSLVVSIVDW